VLFGLGRSFDLRARIREGFDKSPVGVQSELLLVRSVVVFQDDPPDERVASAPLHL
jgi:hypothetical protein